MNKDVVLFCLLYFIPVIFLYVMYFIAGINFGTIGTIAVIAVFYGFMILTHLRLNKKKK